MRICREVFDVVRMVVLFFFLFATRDCILWVK